MELSDARKIVAQTAKQFEAARALEDAASTIIEAMNQSAKATAAYADLKKQIEAAKGELSDCKAQHGKQKDKLKADGEKAVQELNTQLAARQAEADTALKPVLAKISEAKAAYAKELAEHEESIVRMQKQNADLQATQTKLNAAIEKMKAAVSSV